MNLQTAIRENLWRDIASTYTAENYSHAILDAMHHLSNVLRDRSNTDGDGAALVGQALGGDSPRLRLNRLQTETERKVQKGFEEVLRGLYSAIRNPRSHELSEDSKETADAVIYFIDYLLRIIEQSTEPFTIASFLDRVLDPDFFKSPKYARLLVSEIPENKRLDTLIELFRRRLEAEPTNVSYTARAILEILGDEDISRFLAAVSEELRTVTSEDAIRTVLQLLPAALWPRLSEITRLRIENRLLNEIRNGEVLSQDFGREITSHPLGTWARDFLQYFVLKQQAARTLIEKLEDSDSDDRSYVANYFMTVLPAVITDKLDERVCIQAICTWVRDGDAVLREKLVAAIDFYPESWIQTIAATLSDLTDPERPLKILWDGTPFLTDLTLPTEDEIPF